MLVATQVEAGIVGISLVENAISRQNKRWLGGSVHWVIPPVVVQRLQQRPRRRFSGEETGV